MNLHPETTILYAPRPSPSAISPVATDRIRALAVRAMEGAPALTAGEMRELAEAILDHNARSEHAADAERY